MVIFLLFMIVAVLIFILRAMTSASRDRGGRSNKATWASVSKNKSFPFAVIWFGSMSILTLIGTWWALTTLFGG